MREILLVKKIVLCSPKSKDKIDYIYKKSKKELLIKDKIQKNTKSFWLVLENFNMSAYNY
jgi:hypothetical protein